MQQVRRSQLHGTRRWAWMPIAMVLGLALLAVARPPAHAQPAPTADGDPPVGVTVRFQYTGAPQSWTVPAGVTEVYFDVYGAQGGDSSPSVFANQPGGRGGRAQATLPVTPGSVVGIFVGGKGGDQVSNSLGCTTPGAGGAGGFNGGGHGGSAGGGVQCGGPGGGGASDVRIGGMDLPNRRLIAGGGGGAGIVLFYTVPGAGGGLTGGSALGPGGGTGGNQDGTSGSGRLGFGADGETDGDAIGGGGGGGYYGGGGGRYVEGSDLGYGGGGGSGFGPAGTGFQTGVQQGHGVIALTYKPPPPAVTGISPNAGPVTGGTVVTITGTNLTNPPDSTVVTFGTTPATSVSCESSTKCTATSPAGRGSVSVRVTTGGQQSADTPADDFIYVLPPTLTGVSPDQGPAAGGTVVTLTGLDFYTTPGDTTFTFNGVPATGVSCTSTTTCTATTPPHSGHPRAIVTVTTPSGIDEIFGFRYLPDITRISPNAGPRTGGTVVTITGHGFDATPAQTTVAFGATPASAVSCASTTTCTATSPAGSGTVQVTVTTPAATSNGVPFTYEAPPAVTGLSPTAGPVAGGTVVTLSGSGFDPAPGATGVRFGGAAATNVTCTSTTQCTATSPAGSSTVSVTVTTPGGTSNAVPFTYQGGPPPGGLAAQITGCTAQGGGVYDCRLQVTLTSGAPIDTVLRVGIEGATYHNPSGAASPHVVASSGCTTPPLPSPYLAINGVYARYDLNISSGGCQPGAVVTIAEAVQGTPGTVIRQTVSAADLGVASASVTLPAATAPPPPPSSDAAAQLAALEAAAQGAGPAGPGLAAMVRGARQGVEAGQPAAACGLLQGFLTQVRTFGTTGLITPAQATQLTADATRVRAALGCR